MSGPILVMGATGEVGGRVLSGLTALGERVRGASRAPERAASRRPGEWVLLDLESPATFEAALRGVERLFLVARPGDDDPDRVAAPLIEAAVAAGVRHVVNLSAMGAEQDAGFGLRRLEVLLESSGLGYTHLRPNFFMQIFAGPALLPGIVREHAIRIPAADARLSYVDTRDITDVAIAALTESGHAGRAYTLTGPAAIDHAEIARLISAAAATAVTYEPLPEDSARTEMAASGLGPERVERLIGFYRRVRSGHCEPVSGDVEAILGRPARTFAAFAQDYAPTWRPATVAVRVGG